MNADGSLFGDSRRGAGGIDCCGSKLLLWEIGPFRSVRNILFSLC